MKNIKKSNILPKAPGIRAFQTENALFLDIETTGFSGARNKLYLIGTAYVQNGKLGIEQFFAECPEEEPQLLTAWAQFLRDFDTIVSFHGSRFDLPFLEKRSRRLEMELDYGSKKYVDLYQLARSYRHIFGLDNLKQKTLETFLGMERKDRCSGSELIKVYQSYVKQPQEELLTLLLQHNEEDLTGMLRLLALYAFEDFWNGGFAPADCMLAPYRKLNGSDGKELSVTCRLDTDLPAAISCKNDHFYLHAEKDLAHFRVPLTEGTLKYFYSNYKDYYYLPDEDMAVHKSVAFYVDPAHRQKAKAANCYSKRTGLFLPQYEEIVTPALSKEYQDPVSYFEWKDASAKDKTLLKRYCMHILDILKKGA